MILEIENLTKNYGNGKGLNDFSYTFRPGIYGILGPNGAGKSTLMNLLTDNVKRDSGRIISDGTEILELKERYRSQVGYMPQYQGFYEQMSARKYLNYMALVKGLDKYQAKSQVDRYIELVGLKDVAHCRIGSFSGGMKQRVMLSQALLADPGLLILDEPTAGLDPKERIRIRNLISEIAQDKIIILATHVVSDIECIANEVLLMKSGKLIASKSPSALIASVKGSVYERYCTHEEIKKYQQKYNMGNIFQREHGQVLRLVGDNIQDGFELTDSNLGLEDVYMYYFER